MDRAAPSGGDVHNSVRDSEIRYLVQARDIGAVTIHAPPRVVSPLHRAADDLAIRVAAQLRADVAALGIDEQVPMAVRWTATGLPDGGEISELISGFSGLPYPRMLVLGPPGAGKTTLATLLVLGFLRERSECGPVPVLLTVSTWPENEHFHTWMARELVHAYPGLKRAIARRLVAARLVLPVLDGLDEAPESRRPRMLADLNALPTRDAVILTCRDAEYSVAAAESREMNFAAVLRAEPLTVQAAFDYLLPATPSDHVESWRSIRDHVAEHPESPLAGALTSPLMVWLIRSIFARPKADPTVLLDEDWLSSDSVLRDCLLKALIPTVFDSRPLSPDRTVKQWPARGAEAWLRFLARHLVRRRSDDLEWWRLYRAIPVPVRFALGTFLLWLYPRSEMLSVTVDVGGGGLLHSAATADAVICFPMGILGGLLLQMLAATMTGTGYLPAVPLSFRGFTRSQRAKSGPTMNHPLGWAMFVMAVLAALALTVATLDSAARLVTVSILLAAMGMSLVQMWLFAPTDASRAATPQSVLRDARLGDLLLAVLVAPSVGVFMGIADARLGGDGLAAGVAAWLGAAVTMLVAGVWLRFNLARAYLACTGRSPWALMSFLQDAHRLGVLRVTGGTYQFRHRSLRDSLAGLAQEQQAVNPDESGEFRIPVHPWHTSRGMALCLYAIMWGLAALMFVEATEGNAWGNLRVWLWMACFGGVPVVMDLWLLACRWRLDRRFAARRPELVVNAKLISVTVPESVELRWSEVEALDVRPVKSGRGRRTHLYGIQALPVAGADRFPRWNRQPDGWVTLVVVGRDPAVPEEIALALARHAGPRWQQDRAPLPETAATTPAP
ncbi:MAG TPA: NACHT domain-containing protein [Actinospica sp.]|jgi:hypothetical protein|nr:NACHT domain-containing protein [Actinospica sp.]